MDLIRDVSYDPVRQAIVRAQVSMCAELGVSVIAGGIEPRAESSWLLDVGVHLQQGYLFARPGFEKLPTVAWA